MGDPNDPKLHELLRDAIRMREGIGSIAGQILMGFKGGRKENSSDELG